MYYKPVGSERCVRCDCYYNAGNGGALSTSCKEQTGECECRSGVTGRRCDECANPFAEVTKNGCKGNIQINNLEIFKCLTTIDASQLSCFRFVFI